MWKVRAASKRPSISVLRRISLSAHKSPMCSVHIHKCARMHPYAVRTHKCTNMQYTHMDINTLLLVAGSREIKVELDRKLPAWQLCRLLGENCLRTPHATVQDRVAPGSTHETKALPTYNTRNTQESPQTWEAETRGSLNMRSAWST